MEASWRRFSASKVVGAKCTWCLTLVLAAVPAVLGNKPPPDIVLIIADDLGWDDVSFHGSSQIPTSNLDALAADGVILNCLYAQPACTPSRSAIMSGRYPIRTGMQSIPLDVGQPWGLPQDVRILPEYMRELGYETHLVGKWHLGAHKWSFTPSFRGFDSFYGFHYGEEDYYTHSLTYANHSGLDFWLGMEPRWVDVGKYSTDLYTERAKYLIRNRKKSHPLFLVLAHQAPHGTGGPRALEVPKANVKKFPYIGERKRTLFAGMIDSLDESVGEVFETLEEAGKLENTVVFFTSDNGGTPFGSHSSRSFNWPLRGTKLSVWEGSTRVPAFVWSPLLERKRWVSHQPMHFIDLFTTAYSVAGGDTAKLEDVDGLDMWDHMSRGSDGPRTELLYNIDPLEPPEQSVAAIRDSQYKLVIDGTGFNSERYKTEGGRRPYEDLDKLLVQSKTARVLRRLYGRKRLMFPAGWRERATLTCGEGTPENFSANDTVFLFDIVKDPCELNNLASELPEIVSALMKRLDAYRAVAVPPANMPFDPASAPEYHNGTWAPWLD